MPKRPTARELERVAAARPPRVKRPAAPAGEALAMLARRGLRPSLARLDLPFPPDLAGETADRLTDLLGHYAFRLFLRGAIQRGDGFTPADTTTFVKAAQARGFAESLVRLGLASSSGRDRYRLVRPADSFGGTLEWYVGRELARWLGFDVATGVKFHAPGVGGDLDVVAAAEGKLLYLELKSSPPKHVALTEVRAFLRRARAVRPDVALFVVDTALRLSDKVLPMFAEAFALEGAGAPPARRVLRETWALGPHLYVVNAREDLVENVCRAVAEGIRSLAPEIPGG